MFIHWWAQEHFRQPCPVAVCVYKKIQVRSAVQTGGGGASVPELMDADADLRALSVPVGRRGPRDCPSGHHVGRLHIHLRSGGTVLSQREPGPTAHLFGNLILQGPFLSAVCPPAFEVLLGEGNGMLLDGFLFRPFELCLNKHFTLYFHFF